MRSLRARWRSLHRATRMAAVVGALLALLVVAPVAAAMLLLRCCGASGGASWEAWLVVGVVLVAVALLAGTAAGALVSLVLRLLARGHRVDG